MNEMIDMRPVIVTIPRVLDYLDSKKTHNETDLLTWDSAIDEIKTLMWDCPRAGERIADWLVLEQGYDNEGKPHIVFECSNCGWETTLAETSHPIPTYCSNCGCKNVRWRK